MSKYIYSTLTAANIYPTYRRVPGRDLPVEADRVCIQGGANLPSKVFVTPKGVLTVVTDEEFDRLNESKAFKRHVDGGYLVCEDGPHDVAEVAADMTEKDKSAPMVPEDFTAAGQKPPTTASSPNSEEADNSTVRSAQRPAQASTKAKAEKAEDAPKTGRRKRGRPRKTEAAPA